ncbi:hypothetical protein IWW47_000511 [Coemansia sp. RSA 2052]|nr:hypothetical protein IWW47_000511 [Coemansia sp. RSA 2052]
MSISPPKNPLAVKCPTDRCKCVVFQAGKAVLVQRKPREELPRLGRDIPSSLSMPDNVKRMITIPKSAEKPATDDEEEENSYYWMVADVMEFDNVGVSHTKNGIKYLSCADCDLAPIGYYDTEAAAANDNKHEYLIAVGRVAYKPQQQ